MSVDKQRGIDAKSITKPIQLLAAWLTGLVLVNGGFLLTAKAFVNIEWIAATLVVASVVNVPVFLLAIFLLQTKYRPEMQEDLYYHEYLKDKLGNPFSPKVVTASEVPHRDTGEVEGSGGWKDVRVMFNPFLPGSETVKNSLEQHDIPISEEFGSKNWIDEYVVSIGRYLSYEQIGQLLYALRKTAANRVGFAEDDDEVYQWDKTVLIGSHYYDVQEKTLSLNEAIHEYERSKGDVAKFYQVLFDRQRDD